MWGRWRMKNGRKCWMHAWRSPLNCLTVSLSYIFYTNLTWPPCAWPNTEPTTAHYALAVEIPFSYYLVMPCDSRLLVPSSKMYSRWNRVPPPSHSALSRIYWECSETQSHKFLYTFLQELLFMARLLIAQTWLRALPPTIQDWIAAVKAVLMYMKELYTHRGCPAKYSKIWDTWLEFI